MLTLAAPSLSSTSVGAAAAADGEVNESLGQPQRWQLTDVMVIVLVRAEALESAAGFAVAGSEGRILASTR